MSEFGSDELSTTNFGGGTATQSWSTGSIITYGCPAEGCNFKDNDIELTRRHIQERHRINLEPDEFMNDLNAINYYFDPSSEAATAANWSDAGDHWTTFEVSVVGLPPEDVFDPQPEELPSSQPTELNRDLSRLKKLDDTIQEILDDTPPSTRYNIEDAALEVG